MTAIPDQSPCPKCGGPRVRYINAEGKKTSPSCRPCNSEKTLAAYHANPEPAKARSRARYRENPEREKEAARKNYHRNAERRKAQAAVWREANKEHHAELTRKWREANRKRIKAYNQAYYAKNREREIARCLAYTKAHPEIDAAIKNRRRARKVDAVCEHGPKCVTADFLKMIRNSDCLYCTAPGPGHADHFAPLSRGGLHCVENIVPACVSCNTSKHAMDPYDWLAGLTRSVS